MILVPPPVPIPLPIRILNEPDIFTRVLPFLTTALGFLLGLFAEPVKAIVQERRLAKKVRIELYRELASCLVTIEAMERIEDRLEMRDGLRRLREDSTLFESLTWYRENQFNVLARADYTRGVRLASDGLVRYFGTSNQLERGRCRSIVARLEARGRLDKELLSKLEAEEKALQKNSPNPN